MPHADGEDFKLEVSWDSYLFDAKGFDVWDALKRARRRANGEVLPPEL